MRPYFILLEFAAIQTSHHTYLTEETAAFPVIVISLLLIMLLLREWIWKGFNLLLRYRCCRATMM